MLDERQHLGQARLIESWLPLESAEQLRQALRADVELAQLELFAELAELHDAERDPVRRAGYAERYRRLVGVSPDLREQWQNALRAIVAGGRQSVAEVLLAMQRSCE